MTADGQPATLRDIYDLVKDSSDGLRTDIKDVRDELNAKLDALRERVTTSETDMGITVSTLRTNLGMATNNVEGLLRRVDTLEKAYEVTESRRLADLDHHDRERDWRRHMVSVASYFGSAAVASLITLWGSGGIHH